MFVLSPVDSLASRFDVVQGHIGYVAGEPFPPVMPARRRDVIRSQCVVDGEDQLAGVAQSPGRCQVLPAEILYARLVSGSEKQLLNTDTVDCVDVSGILLQLP